MKKLLSKLFSKSELALIRKDLHEIGRQRLVRSSLIILPLLLTIGLPLLFALVSAFAPVEQLSDVEQFKTLLGTTLPDVGVRGQMFYIFTNYICPMLFVLIPMMSASVAASCSFVGEKEHGTMETLLLSPLSVRKLFQVKVAGCSLLSGAVTLISFVLFFVVTVIGDILTGAPFFLNLNWLILVFLLSPALTVLGITFLVMISGRSKTTMEAVQVSGYIVLPLTVAEFFLLP
ncbi:MAG: ABC transporter permease subunit, partial [Hominenteromicrobium sp.]